MGSLQRANDSLMAALALIALEAPYEEIKKELILALEEIEKEIEKEGE